MNSETSISTCSIRLLSHVIKKLLYLQWSSRTSLSWMKVDEVFGKFECDDETILKNIVPAKRHSKSIKFKLHWHDSLLVRLLLMQLCKASDIMKNENESFPQLIINLYIYKVSINNKLF